MSFGDLFCARCWFLNKKQRYADFVVNGDSKCWDCYNAEILEFKNGKPETRNDKKKLKGTGGILK